MLSQINSLHSKIAQPAVAQQAFVASAGLAIFAHIAFIAPALYFLSRAKLRTDGYAIESWLVQYASILVWMPAILVISLFFAMRPAPQDDLLAISAIASGYFTHSSFAFSSWGLQPVSPWFGFEKVVALATRHLGPENGIYATQATAVVSTTISVTLAIRDRMNKRPDLVLQAIILIGLALASMTLGRSISGRVEAFFFAWAIAAIWMPTALWFALGLVMSPMYWLAWIYAPAALLLKAPLYQRFVTGLIYALFSGGIWLGITDGRYPEMFTLTSSWLAERQFTVMENVSLLQGLPASPAAIVLIVAAGFFIMSGKGSRKDAPLAIVAIWFALPDMIRYLPVIATIAAIWIISSIERGTRFPRPSIMLLAILVPLTIAFTNTLPAGKLENLPNFTIPSRSVVLGPLESGLYATIHHNPGIKVTPSFELGATDPVIQKAAQRLQTGKFECGLMRFYSIDYVIENRLKEVPACLTLDQVQGTWRLWKTSAHSKETI